MMNCREEFEKWFVLVRPDVKNLSRNDFGKYIIHEPRIMYEAWEAAWNLLNSN